MLLKLSSLVGVVIVLAAAGTAWSQSDGTPADFSPAGAAATPKIAALAGDQKSAFAVLRRAPGTADQADAKWIAGGQQLFGLNAAMARRVAHDANLFLVPGKSAMCLAGPDNPTLCGPADKVESGRLIGTSQCGGLPQGTASIYGVLPDGATNVALYSSAGASPVKADGNAYRVMIDVRQPLPETLQFDTPSGHSVVHVPLPDNTATAICAYGETGP